MKIAPVVRTFPLPPQEAEPIVADRWQERGLAALLDFGPGLNDVLNRVHDPTDTTAEVTELRRLHLDLDHAVAAAYGWDDLDLDHGFHETPQGVRFTIGPLGRVEVLDRLLELNHERYATEVAAGLHVKGAGKGRRKAARAPAAREGDRLF